MILVAALELEQARLISVCGAGGKTTLIFSLAKEYVSAGENVLITTTTKMAESESRGRYPAVETNSLDEILDHAEDSHGKSGAIIAYSRISENREKIIGYAPEFIDAIANAGWFDRILVEADGSRRKPLKAAGNREPVFPQSSDTVIMIAGLSGVGQILHEDNLFRADIWARLTGLKTGDKITAKSLAQMIAHKDGMARGCPAHVRKIAFLNRADSPENFCNAQTVMQTLANLTRDRTIHLVAGWLLPDPGVVELSDDQT